MNGSKKHLLIKSQLLYVANEREKYSPKWFDQVTMGR